MTKYHIEGKQVFVTPLFDTIEADSPEEAVSLFDEKHKPTFRADAVDVDDEHYGYILGYCESCGCALFDGTIGRDYKYGPEDGIYLCSECYK